MVVAPLFAWPILLLSSLRRNAEVETSSLTSVEPSQQQLLVTGETSSPLHTINPLQQAVQMDRSRRLQGVWAGGTLLTSGTTVGLASGILHWPEVVAPLAVAACAVQTWLLSCHESQPPLPDDFFEVQISSIPNAGKGLFATRDIPQGAYLFAYAGDRLTETQYFDRYPQGDGCYVAVLPSLPWSLNDEPIYVDGAPLASGGWSRWMNSQSSNPSVRGRKSRTEPRNFHFYAARDIKKGEELCFDYGANYWDAFERQQE